MAVDYDQSLGKVSNYLHVGVAGDLANILRVRARCLMMLPCFICGEFLRIVLDC